MSGRVGPCRVSPRHTQTRTQVQLHVLCTFPLLHEGQQQRRRRIEAPKGRSQ